MSQFDSIADIAKVFASVSERFTLMKFLKWIVAMLLIGGGSIYVFNTYFSFNQHYDELDRKVSIVKEIVQLRGTDTLMLKKVDVELIEILNNLESPISADKHVLTNSDWSSLMNAENLLKLVIGLLVPFLMFFTMEEEVKTDTDTRVGIVFIGLISVVISLALPVLFGSLWFNLLIVCVSEIIILVLIGTFMK